MMCLLSLTIGLLAVPAAPAADPPRDVPVSKIGTEFRLIGDLHERLGTVMTIQGVVVEGRRKELMGERKLWVQRVNGRATQEDIQMKFKHTPDMKIGETYELKGFETGTFIGTPHGTRELGDNTVGLAIPAFHLMTYFEFNQAEKIKPIRLSPADFVDREALFEGRAVSDGKRAYIAGDGWRLLVDANTPWAKEDTDKVVEALGTMRKTDERSTYRLEKGVARLVRLEDQVGRRVTLRGTASTSNDHWWFNYRGTNLNFDNMKDQPGWTADLYDVPVVIEGILDEAVLPVVNKENPKRKKQFIVRKPTWKRLDALLSPERVR